MSRRLITMLLVGATIAIMAALPATVGAKTTKVLEFDRMAGVPLAYTGAKAPIRGIQGGGAPWVIASAKGELGVDGSLEIKFRGLVLDPNDPGNIRNGVAGTNPVGTMRAVVSCESVDSTGAAVDVNLRTDPFPVTTGPATSGGGNGSVDTSVSLPSPCIAPIVLITTASGFWFAATGV
jgi:hypothetical protein